MNTYPLDTTVELSTLFVGSDNVTPFDPTDVSVVVRSPNGGLATYTATDGVANPSVGRYTFDLITTMAGPYVYNWLGSGDVEVASGDTYFTVAQSATVIG